MPEPENYAVYIAETDELLSVQPTLRRAFDLVTDRLVRVQYALDTEGGQRVLRLRQQREPLALEVLSAKALEGDAWNDLMRQSLDGRLGGFAAMPVRAFHQKPRRRLP